MTDPSPILRWIREHCLGNDADRPLDTETPLLEGTMDSLQIVQLVGFLESEYGVGVEIDEMVPENFETPGRVAAMVDRLRGATSG